MKRTALLSAAAALVLTLLAPGPGSAAGPGHTVFPSPEPASGTPAVENGRVLAIQQVGSTVVVGGTFSAVTPDGGPQRAVSSVFAFDAATGDLVDDFDPDLNGGVEDLLPGPIPGTVYLAGRFSNVNGDGQSHVTLLDVETGEIVPGFQPAATNGRVYALANAHGRLLLGGTFTRAGGQPHGGLASVDPLTGDLDDLMGVDVSGHHNDTGGGAQGAVGPRHMVATSSGDQVAVVGNFKQADGLPRDQLVVLDVTDSSATVDPNWRTRRYEPYCYNWAFDTYMRGLAISPDDSYFVVTTTGGANPGTLCDSASRFEFDSSGDDIQPTWTDHSGGDTLVGVDITENAVYVGGHQRWMNNSEGRDSNGQGSVPRAGLTALDPDSGVPLPWNPGRNPRGVAAFAIHATETGVWVGSNTEWIGNRRYRRPRLAFFPLAGGTAPVSDVGPGLPADVYLAGALSVDQGNVLHRVNAGGPALAGIDGGPGWVADDGASSPYRNSGSNAAAWPPGAAVDATVPASTPGGVFDSERWSPSDNPRMSWDFPADVGLPLQVRLYFANRCTCTNDPGERVFHVDLEGQRVLQDFDIAAAVGDQRGTMRSFDITSDGNVDIDFAHATENPLVNAIEIVRRDLPPPAPADNALTTIAFDGDTPGTPTPVDPRGIDWNAVRGAFILGDTLFYAETDGYLHRRTFTADQTGADQRIDPYNDPEWSDVDTGSGQTYRGRLPDLYGQLSGLSGLVYDDDRIYYTRSGQSELFWRWFNADSGIVGSQLFTASGGSNWSDTGGLFLDDGTLYVVSRSTGDLSAMPFDDGPQGSATLVDQTRDWRANALFIGPDGSPPPPPPPPPNEPPEAAFTIDCDGLVCSLDGSGSDDSDGSIESWAWSFGDGDTDTGETTQHEYAGAGTYTVTLEVTDDDGATDTATQPVTVDEDDPPPPTGDIEFVASASRTANSPNPWVELPGSVQAGDLLVLVGSYAPGGTPADPTGWTRLDDATTQGIESVVWTRRATAGDAGARVETPLTRRRKFALTVGSYQGVADPAAVAAWASATSPRTNQHQSPSVQAPAGAWVVQVWSDRSSTTTDWTPPSGVTQREEAIGPGGGRVTSLFVDSGAGVPAGTVGGQTATTDDDGGRGIAWTLALAPAP